MPISTRVDVEHGVAIRVVTGELHADDMLVSIDEVMAAPGFHYGLHALWDLREATAMAMSPDEVRQLVAGIGARAENVEGRPGKSAIVVVHDVDFGMMRMFDTLGDHLPVDRKIFRSYDDAWKWLTED